MRTIVAAAAIALLASTTTYAVKKALTIEGVQMAIKAMGCTVEDNNIEVYLDKDFKVTKKVKED
jgi:hypothetical protein